MTRFDHWNLYNPFPPFPPHVTPPETSLDTFADWSLVVGCGLIVLFTLLYGVGFRWWRTRAGRAVLGVFISVSLLLLSIVIAKTVGGDYPGRDVLRLVVFICLPASMLYMVYGLVRNFIEGPTDLTIERRGGR
jgi:hypothetical protein